MKRWWWIVAFVLSLGINVGILSTLALRQKEPARVTRQEPRSFEQLANRLQIQGEDRERFIALQQRFLRELRKNQKQGRRLQVQLWRELGVGEPDTARIEALVQEIGKVQGRRTELVARVVLESRDMLDRRQLRVYRRFLARANHRSSQKPRAD